MIPVLPTILKDLDLTGGDLGVLVSVFALFQMIGSPFSGRAADKFGKKKIICIGLLLFSISEFIFAMGGSLSILMLSRILGGVSAAFIMPGVNGMIGDLSTKATRAKNFSYMSAVINTGFIVGPGIGGFLADISHRAPFIFAGALGILAFLSSVFMLEETNQPEELTEKTHLKKAFSYKPFIVPVIIMFILSYGISSIETMFPLYTADKASYTPKDISIAITGGAIIGVIFQIGLFERVVHRIGEIKLVFISLVYSIIIFGLFSISNSYGWIMVISFVMFIGFDLIRPAMTNYFSILGGANQGTAGGLNSAATSVGNLIGPLFAGLVYDFDIHYPIYIAIAFFLVGSVILIFHKFAHEA